MSVQYHTTPVEARKGPRLQSKERAPQKERNIGAKKLRQPCDVEDCCPDSCTRTCCWLNSCQLAFHDFRRQLERIQQLSNRRLKADFNGLPQLARRQEHGQQGTLARCDDNLLMSESRKVYIPITESCTWLNGRRELRWQT